MDLLMFSIFDVATKNFNTPFFMTTEAEAVRSVRHLVNDENTTLSKSPMDYYLYLVGNFDTDTAGIDQDSPKKLCWAFNLKESEPEELKENLKAGGDA